MMGLCRRIKIKHVAGFVLAMSVFLYGILQTLYLLSPALERLSQRIYPGDMLHEGQGHHQQQGQPHFHGNQDLDSHNARGLGHVVSLDQGQIPQGQVLGSKMSQDGQNDEVHKGYSHEGQSKDGGNVLRYRVVVNPSPKVQTGRRRSRSHDIDSSSSVQDKVKKHKPTVSSSKIRNTQHSEYSKPPRQYCPNVERPKSTADSQSWHTVIPDFLYIYSAFYESRLWQPAVRVITVMQQKPRTNVSFCHVWTEGATHPEVVPVDINIVPEGHMDRKFAVYILTCKLQSDKAPVAVSVVTHRCQSTANQIVLPVLNTDASRERRVDFTVCFTPLHFHYNDTRQLVESVELNRMFGAGRFQFYNYSTGPDIGRYLRSYNKDDLADVLPWTLPVAVDTWPPSTRKPDIHYFGQLAALNDCLYRNMYKSRYLVFSDLDEIIVPKVQNTWKDLLLKLQKEYKQKRFSKFGAFIFQCVFFRTDWPDDGNVTSLPAARKYKLMSLLKTKREADVFPWGMRSKYIIDPLKVAMVGIHNVWKFIANRYMESNIKAEVGLLHHYRYWEEPAGTPPILDNSLHKYTDVILSRVRQRHDIVPTKGHKSLGR